MEKNLDIFAEEHVPNTRKCSKCREYKNPDTDFYIFKGIPRGECKSCTIKWNISNQKKKKLWKTRTDSQRSYMLEYYQTHKEQFAEYRRAFKEKHPNYHRDYFRTYVRKN